MWFNKICSIPLLYIKEGRIGTREWVRSHTRSLSSTYKFLILFKYCIIIVWATEEFALQYSWAHTEI